MIPRRFLWSALTLSLVCGAMSYGRAADGPLAVRITSPLGRTGTPGVVRIVARIDRAPDTIIQPVRFYVDGALYKIDNDGAPFAVEWFDENPFERRELAVEVEDTMGHIVRDAVVLQPFVVTEKTEVFGALIETTVRDKTGRFIRGLDRTGFTLEEDGVSQKLDLVSQEDVPATFVLLIDSSQSMGQRFEFVRQAADRLVGYLRPRDRVIVAPFSKALSVITGPTDDRETILDAINILRASGGTAIFDGLTEMAERLAGGQGRTSVILITDGYDEHSRGTFADALDAAKQADLTVYPIGIGGTAGISLKGQLELKKLAAETGGRAYFPARAQDLADVYDRLAVDAQNRYLLAYTPLNQVQDGSWRQVSVTTSSPDDIVLARIGYYAPKAPPVRPTIEFTVTDVEQRYVDVTKDDLIVREDGVEQEVDTFQEAVDPVQLVLTLDESGSMKKDAEAVKAAARGFVRALRPEDPLALITFADKATFAHDLATNREWSLDAIDHYQTIGGTALYDALHDSLMRLKALKGRRAVVVMTDGRDENNPGTAPGSIHTLDQVMDRAREVDSMIFPIGLGPKVDRNVLAKLAEISGGRAFFPSDVAQLDDEYRAVLENLRRRYVLGYASTNPARDGKWRKVEISARLGSLQIKSRGGYFAPEK